jgi:arginyl-tRNA synthetase
LNIRCELERRLSAALAEATGEQAPAIVGPSKRPELGDYQANGVMAVAKGLRTNPRELAAKVAAAADLSDLAEPPEVAGPGFINIRLRADFLAARAAEALEDDRLGAPPAERPRTVVVDYSAPNLAKEMHVGHLRSTIIGDALARTLDFLGHRVIRQNHVGDWGTQFGMLMAYLDSHTREYQQKTDVITNIKGVHINDMEAFYRNAKQLFDGDAEFAEASRRYVVALQRGDQHCRELWEVVFSSSLFHCDKVYRRLGIEFEPDEIRGESAYNEDLPRVVADLAAAGLLSESEGARCVFLEQFKGKDGEPLPVIVQKSDGGYLYATTDLAAIRYRVGQLGADRVLYVVDARQSLHFQQIFAVARAAAFAGEGVSLEHVAFGTMQGEDGRPFRTRTGGTVKLMDLLDQAVERAERVVREKNPDLSEEQVRRTAETVGVGAVKYADLAQHRASDYVFSFDRMLSLDGNTAPYMQYAYARIRSIRRKGEGMGVAGAEGGQRLVECGLAETQERQLALKLGQFPETVQSVADECLPHLLCAYLYDLAVAFTGFYENCPVLKSDEPTRSARLALCEATARTIRGGLKLLGIETLEQM